MNVGLAAAIALSLGLFACRSSGMAGDANDAQCGPGFVAVGARCCATARATNGLCESSPALSRKRVTIAATSAVIGPSDWEAEGRVAPRTLNVASFAIDAFETTVAEMDAKYTGGDGARAASGISRDEASRHCAAVGGRLPTEDEWIAAAAGASGRRYPWGDTGAVCRRAAWGLAAGPCSQRGGGPDTVGAHPDGDSPDGVHDLAGNVAEWVVVPGAPASLGVARGGSWRTSLAAELRTWARLEIDPAAHDARVGVRCAYDLR